MMPTLTIRCTYPKQLGSEPSEVTFRLSPAHGCETSEEALQLIECLQASHDYFELQPHSDEAPFLFWSETISAPSPLPESCRQERI